MGLHPIPTTAGPPARPVVADGAIRASLDQGTVFASFEQAVWDQTSPEPYQGRAKTLNGTTSPDSTHVLHGDEALYHPQSGGDFDYIEMPAGNGLPFYPRPPCRLFLYNWYADGSQYEWYLELAKIDSSNYLWFRVDGNSEFTLYVTDAGSDTIASNEGMDGPAVSGGWTETEVRLEPEGATEWGSNPGDFEVIIREYAAGDPPGQGTEIARASLTDRSYNTTQIPSKFYGYDDQSLDMRLVIPAAADTDMWFDKWWRVP